MGGAAAPSRPTGRNVFVPCSESVVVGVLVARGTARSTMTPERGAETSALPAPAGSERGARTFRPAGSTGCRGCFHME
eukprot:5055270-Alexandrium_andersonii.AAC.1